ncbi:MAG: S8 family peptidase [Bacteroidales bacterium]|jgi:subtilisin family serine protease|nr:S8 family peptidase [Bacteroidales bacterium]
MKKIVFITLLIALNAVYAQQAKLSPYTRAIVHQTEQLQRDGKPINDSAFVNKFALSLQDNIVYANCFMQTSETFDSKALENLGVKLNAHAGKIWTCLIPISQIENVKSVEGVYYIDASEPVKLFLDSARAKSNVEQVHSGAGLSQAYKGTGVIVGIIDNGFDYTHPTFYDNTHTNYRVKRVWEQNGSGTPPSGYSIGAEYTSQTAILNRQHDHTNGNHATHVAGIAGGSGGVNNASLRGVAPESDLVFVSTNMTSTGIANGASYIKNYALSQSKPCVINMSLGSNRGPNDGTSSFEQFMDNIASSGVIPVISAGNEGNNPLFATKTQTGVDTMNVICNIDTDFDDGYAYVWGSNFNHFSVAVALYNTATNTYIATTTFTQTSNSSSYSNSVSSGSNTCDVQIYAESADNYNYKPNALIMLSSVNLSSNVKVVIRVRSSATEGTNTSIWCTDFSLDTSVPNSTFTSGSTDQTINCLATGYNTIAVGAWTSKNNWITLGGSNYGYWSDNVGDIADFSSKGPTSDGRVKPTIAAPGHALVSSYSNYSDNVANPTSSATIVASQTHNATTWYYGVASGTSMSSPFAAGVIALWLQKNPSLTPAQVINVMQNTAIIDSYTGTYPPVFIWGYGKLNALAGIQQITTETPPSVTTNDATNITPTSATLNGTVIQGSEPIIARGFSLYDPFSLTYLYFQGNGTTNITADISNLRPAFTYTFWAFAVTGSDTVFGNPYSLSTLSPVIASVLTDSVVISENAATLYGTVVQMGNPAATELGFEVTIGENNPIMMPVQFTSSTVHFNTTVNRVNGINNYKCRAYIQSYDDTISYGEIKSWAYNSLMDISPMSIGLRISPNPSRESAVVEISGLTKDAMLLISNMQGQQYEAIKLKANQTELTLDLRNYPFGTYNLKLVSDELSVSQKLIIFR